MDLNSNPENTRYCVSHTPSKSTGYPQLTHPVINRSPCDRITKTDLANALFPR